MISERDADLAIILDTQSTEEHDFRRSSAHTHLSCKKVKLSVLLHGLLYIRTLPIKKLVCRDLCTVLAYWNSTVEISWRNS